MDNVFWFAHTVANTILVLDQVENLKNTDKKSMIDGLIINYIKKMILDFTDKEIDVETEILRDNVVNASYFGYIEDNKDRIYGYIVGAIDNVLSKLIEDNVEVVDD